MKFLKLLFILNLIQSSFAMTEVEAEDKYNQFLDEMESVSYSDISYDLLDTATQKILIDSLWDYVANPTHKGLLSTVAKTRWDGIVSKNLPTAELIRYFVIGTILKAQADELKYVAGNLQKKLMLGDFSRRDFFVLLNLQNALKSNGLKAQTELAILQYPKLLEEYEKITKSSSEVITKADISALTSFEPEITSSRNKSYNDATKFFIFCRKNRAYPCLSVLKNSKGQWIKNESNDFWKMPLLAMSKLKIAFHHENGNTPSGVYAIRGVMPVADKPLEYGLNRRMNLEFMDEKSAKEALPAQLSSKNWWRQTLLAKEIGRGSLRVHGTQRVNDDKNSSYYPFVPSFGCLKLREGNYDGVEYNSQRILLDSMMSVQNLKASVANEVNIRALVYLIDIDSQNRAVELKDVAFALK